MLSAPALEAEVVKTMAGAIIMILSTVMTRLSILDEITKRWARGRDRYRARFLLDVVKVRASRPPLLLLLLLLCTKMGEALFLGHNKSFDHMGMLKCLCIYLSWIFWPSNSSCHHHIMGVNRDIWTNLQRTGWQLGFPNTDPGTPLPSFPECILRKISTEMQP